MQRDFGIRLEHDVALPKIFQPVLRQLPPPLYSPFAAASISLLSYPKLTVFPAHDSRRHSGSYRTRDFCDFSGTSPRIKTFKDVRPPEFPSILQPPDSNWTYTYDVRDHHTRDCQDLLGQRLAENRGHFFPPSPGH